MGEEKKKNVKQVSKGKSRRIKQEWGSQRGGAGGSGQNKSRHKKELDKSVTKL